MELKFKKTMTIVILSVLAFTCYAEDALEPNESATEKKADSFSESPESESTAQLVPEADNSAGQVEAKLATEYYKDCVQNLKWALGIIIGLVVGIVGYALFKNTREYRQALVDVKEALNQAREACREAREASDKARDYEEKAQERLSGINEEVESKLKEIEVKSGSLIAEMIEEAEKQRKISELWRKGSKAYDTGHYKLAVKYYEQLLEEDSKDVESLINCGLALASQGEKEDGAKADELFKRAYEKFAKAAEIRPDYDIIWSNWADALITQSWKKVDKERIDLLHQAIQKCLKAEEIKRGAGAYNLACAYSLLNDKEECKRWLKVGEEENTLMSRDYAMNDKCFMNVRNEEWFEKIRWPKKSEYLG